MYIWTIGRAPARGRLFFAICNFVSDSFLLGFGRLDYFWFSSVLVHLTPATEIFWDPDMSSFSWLPLHIVRGIPSLNLRDLRSLLPKP
jgi:hypothetical protein